MADILKMFPFNEIKTNQTVGSSTSAVFFPKMYFCNKTLESGPYKGKFAYLVSKYGGSGYHLAPTFYNEGMEVKTGVYFAKYNSFPNGNTSGWLKCNIYDYHFLLRLYLISGVDYGGLIKRGECHYSFGKIPGSYLSGASIAVHDFREIRDNTPIMILDNKRQGQYVPNATFYPKFGYIRNKTSISLYPATFRTDSGNGFDFGDLFIPGAYTEDFGKAITRSSFGGVATNGNDGKVCIHVENPPDYDIFRFSDKHFGLGPYHSESQWNDGCIKEVILYVKVV